MPHHDIGVDLNVAIRCLTAAKHRVRSSPYSASSTAVTARRVAELVGAARSFRCAGQ